MLKARVLSLCLLLLIGQALAGPETMTETSSQAQAEDLMRGLTGYQRFHVYPYLEKAYQRLRDEQLDMAIDQIDHALQITPTHLPLVRYQVNLLLRAQRYDEAQQLLSQQPQLTELNDMRLQVATLYVTHSQLSATDFVSYLTDVDADTKSSLILNYLQSQAARLTAAELQQLYQQLAIAQASATLVVSFNEALFKHQAYAFVKTQQQRRCQQLSCSEQEWVQLIQAQIATLDVTDIDAHLMQVTLSQRQSLTDYLIQRWVGAQRGEELLPILSELFRQDSLTLSQRQQSYQLARRYQHQALALALLATLPLDCAARARQALELDNSVAVGEILADCSVTADNELEQLNLLVVSQNYELLAAKRLVSVSAENKRINALLDVYQRRADWPAIIALLTPRAKQLLAPQRYQLLDALAANGQTQRAAVIGQGYWLRDNDSQALALSSYYWLAIEDYDAAIELLVDAVSQHPQQFMAVSVLVDRLKNLLMQQPQHFSDQQLQQLAQQQSLLDEVALTYLARHQCQAALALNQHTTAALAVRIRRQCIADDIGRVNRYLAQPQRSQEETEEVIFIALRNGLYQKADELILSLADWRDDVAMLEARLSIAEQQHNEPRQQQLLERLAEIHPDAAYVALKRGFFDYQQRNFSRAANNFEVALSSRSDLRQPLNLEQAAFAHMRIEQDSRAKAYLMSSIQARQIQTDVHSEGLAKAQSLYRQVASPWQFDMAGWWGDSTSVSQVTGNDFQADYFVSTELRYNLNYDDRLGTDLQLAAGTLSGGDDFFFDNKELDLHLRWKPMLSQLLYARVGWRQRFDGGGGRSYLRLSYDPLLSQRQAKPWLQQQGWSHSLFLDQIFYLNDRTASFFARYTPSYNLSGEQQLFYSWSLYPFVQYQSTNDVGNRAWLDDTRVGAGISWRFPWLDDAFKGHQFFSELGVEWQHVLHSQFSDANGNALLLRFSVSY